MSDWAIVARELLDHWWARGNRSHDPYDGLATRWVRDPARLTRAVRLGLVQLHKRSPVNLRPLFRIPPLRSAYADGHFASAAVLLGDDRAQAMLSWLEASRIDGGWGYPFDVQTKTHFYPRTTPNVVCTAFAAQAFLDAGDEQHTAIAREAAAFCAKELLVEEGGERWFGYHPGDRDLIHNANLLAARLCARAGEPEIAADAVAATLRRQNADGSFAYGAGPRLAWVDGHHTGFVVESLADLRDALPGGPVTDDALERAAGFYRERLFRSDGLPRQAPARDLPVDPITGAQGIQTFAKLDDLAIAERVARWMLANMRRRDGTFVFRRGRVLRTRVPYARWCDAPMALALATLASRSGGTS